MLDLDPKTAELIRYKAAKLARSPGFRRGDEEDIRQELALRVVERMRRHDPSRASARTFATRVVVNKVVDLARCVHARYRHAPRQLSLDDEVPARTVAELGKKSWGHDRHVRLRVDLDDSLASLPDDDRAVAL